MGIFRIVEDFITFMKQRRPAPSQDVHIEDRITDELKAESALYSLLESSKGLVSQLFFQAITSKKQLVELVDDYKDTFFHSAVVDMIVDDVISIDPGMNNIVDMTSENELVREMLEELQERLDIDSFIQTVIEDVVAYGDVVVAVEHDGRMVQALHPIPEQGDVVVAYKGSAPKFLVKWKKRESTFEVTDYIDFIHFCVPGRKIKVKVEKEFMEAVGVKGEIDEYFRLGKPLFWGCWDLLNSLYMLLIFYPVFSVQKLNATTVLGVRVPREMPPEKAYQVARKYMELLNVNIAVDRLGRVSVADVIDTVGRYKVIPVFAEDEKGLLQLNDPRLEENYALDVVDELKRTLCASIGVPYQFLFGSTEMFGKLETLKAFNRYVKKITKIQSAITQGLTQLAVIEAKLRGYKVTPSMIDVRFRNSIIGVEQLDKLEFLAGMIDTVNSSVNIVSEIADKVKGQVDTEKLVEFVNMYLGLVGLDGVIKSSGDVITPEPGGETGAGFDTGAGGFGAGAGIGAGLEAEEFEEEPEEEFELKLG